MTKSSFFSQLEDLKNKIDVRDHRLVFGILNFARINNCILTPLGFHSYVYHYGYQIHCSYDEKRLVCPCAEAVSEIKENGHCSGKLFWRDITTYFEINGWLSFEDLFKDDVIKSLPGTLLEHGKIESGIEFIIKNALKETNLPEKDEFLKYFSRYYNAVYRVFNFARVNSFIITPDGYDATITRYLRAQHCPCYTSRTVCPCPEAVEEIRGLGHCYCQLFYRDIHTYMRLHDWLGTEEWEKAIKEKEEYAKRKGN